VRADIVPGGVFPDYELTDHTRTRRTLSELQGINPMILLLSRGHFCPKENQQHLELAASYRRSRWSTPRSSPSRRTTSSRPASSGLRSAPRGPSCPTPAARSPGTSTSPSPRPNDPAHLRAQAGSGHPQRLHRLLVLGPAIVRGPAPRPARGDPRNPPGLGTWPHPACARTGTPATTPCTARTSQPII